MDALSQIILRYTIYHELVDYSAAYVLVGVRMLQILEQYTS
jgi:hypothetical protein